jgi:uncharacterized phage-associated protein
MATAIDTAKYLVEKYGEMSAMKVHKLAYYCQAWHMVWFERELFPEDFQAWANGPVIRSLYALHRKQFLVNSQTFAQGNADALSDEQKAAIDKVMNFYGEKNAQWLSDLTHREDPWRLARGVLPPGAASDAIIDKASMHEYYSAL